MPGKYADLLLWVLSVCEVESFLRHFCYKSAASEALGRDEAYPVLLCNGKLPGEMFRSLSFVLAMSLIYHPCVRWFDLCGSARLEVGENRL